MTGLISRLFPLAEDETLPSGRAFAEIASSYDPGEIGVNYDPTPWPRGCRRNCSGKSIGVNPLSETELKSPVCRSLGFAWRAGVDG